MALPGKEKNTLAVVCGALITPFWPKDGLHRPSDNPVLRDSNSDEGNPALHGTDGRFSTAFQGSLGADVAMVIVVEW